MKRYRKLRKLKPDDELFRRRAAEEPLREIAPDYGVVHTSLGRYLARPEAVRKLKRAKQRLREEERAEDARWRAEQKAKRLARKQLTDERDAAEAEAEAEASQSQAVSAALGGERSSAPAPSRQLRPLELEPFSEAWLTWYAERRHLSQIDWLNFHDARRGIVPPRERRARERGASVH